MFDEHFYLPEKTAAVTERAVLVDCHQLQGRAQIPFPGDKKNTVVQQETAITVEVIQELTEDELADRHRLEMKVERGIEQIERTLYQIGIALRELRERRLYRSTHRRWSDYCNERFSNIKRRQADYFILASEVIDDLKNGHNCAHFPLPTSESQIRSMKSLTPVERVEAWQTGVNEFDGEVPTAKTIKGIVERIKERNTTPPQIPYQLGDVFLISAKSGELKKYSGCWAIATQIKAWIKSR